MCSFTCINSTGCWRPRASVQYIPYWSPRWYCQKISTPTFASFGELLYLSVTLFQTSSFMKTLLLWFSSHYVLNMHYAKPVSEVCLFFQEYIFGQPQNTKNCYISVHVYWYPKVLALKVTIRLSSVVTNVVLSLFLY